MNYEGYRLLLLVLAHLSQDKGCAVKHYIE